MAQAVADGIDVEHRAAGHDERLVPLVEQLVDEFQRVGLVYAGGVILRHGLGVDEIMPHG